LFFKKISIVIYLNLAVIAIILLNLDFSWYSVFYTKKMQTEKLFIWKGAPDYLLTNILGFHLFLAFLVLIFFLYLKFIFIRERVTVHGFFLLFLIGCFWSYFPTSGIFTLWKWVLGYQ
jgi:hypothetical protein